MNYELIQLKEKRWQDLELEPATVIQARTAV